MMKTGYVYLIATAICWSFIGVLIRFNTQSAILIHGVTSFIALLFSLMFASSKLVLNKLVVLVALAQVMTGLTFVYANQLTSVGNAIVLQYTSMIFVLVYQSIDHHSLPHPRQICIIIMAIMGMVLFFFDALSLQGFLGNILAITSGAFFGIQFYLNTKPKAAPLSSAILSYAISCGMLVFIFDSFYQVHISEWLIMLLSGLICTGLAGLFFAKGIQKCNPFSANIICMGEVILAPLWTFLLFHETLGARSILGAMIIISAVLLNMLFDYQKMHTHS